MKGESMKRTTFNKWRAGLAIVALIGAMVATIATTGLGAPSDPVTESPVPGSQVAKADAVDPRLSEHFSILREPQEHGEGDRTGTGQYGANLALAREVKVGDAQVAVIPANGHVCLATPAGGGCSTVRDALAGDLWLTEFDGAKLRTAYILVPDDAEALSIESGKSSSPARAERNMVIVTDSSATGLQYEHHGELVSIEF